MQPSHAENWTSNTGMGSAFKMFIPEKIWWIRAMHALNSKSSMPPHWILPPTHDDVIKWKHFSRYWPFVWGIHRSPVNSPHKGQWRGALMFSLICSWINGWVNSGEAGDLRRHRVHFDLTVMPPIPSVPPCCYFVYLSYLCHHNRYYHPSPMLHVR